MDLFYAHSNVFVQYMLIYLSVDNPNMCTCSDWRSNRDQGDIYICIGIYPRC